MKDIIQEDAECSRCKKKHVQTIWHLCKDCETKARFEYYEKINSVTGKNRIKEEGGL